MSTLVIPRVLTIVNMVVVCPQTQRIALINVSGVGSVDSWLFIVESDILSVVVVDRKMLDRSFS